MILAIIIDTYTEVKKLAVDSETVWGWAQSLFWQWRENFHGRRVSLDHIATSLQHVKGEGHLGEKRMRHRMVLRLEDLLVMVPGLQRPQANRLMCRALNHFYVHNSWRGAAKPDLGHAVDVVQKIDYRTRKIIKITKKQQKQLQLQAAAVLPHVAPNTQQLEHKAATQIQKVFRGGQVRGGEGDGAAAAVDDTQNPRQRRQKNGPLAADALRRRSASAPPNAATAHAEPKQAPPPRPPTRRERRGAAAATDEAFGAAAAAAAVV